jgi:hypothetical protein
MESKLFARLGTCKTEEREIDAVIGIEPLPDKDDRDLSAILTFPFLEQR